MRIVRIRATRGASGAGWKSRSRRLTTHVAMRRDTRNVGNTTMSTYSGLAPTGVARKASETAPVAMPAHPSAISVRRNLATIDRRSEDGSNGSPVRSAQRTARR